MDRNFDYTPALNEEAAPARGPIPLSPRRRTSGTSNDSHEQLDFFLRRKWLIIGVFLGVFALGALYTFTRRPIYDATAQLVVVSRTGSSPGADDQILGTLAGLTQGRNTGTQLEILQGDDLLNEAFTKLTPKERELGFRPKEGELDLMPHWAYHYENDKDTDVINIRASSFSPKIAAELANNIAHTYLQRDLERNGDSTRQAKHYVQKELGKAKLRMENALAVLAKYKKNAGVLDVPTTETSETQALFTLEAAEITDLELVDESNHRLAILRQQLPEIPNNIRFGTQVSQNPQYAQLQATITDLESKRAADVVEYKAGAPELQDVDKALKLNQDKLAKVTQNIISQTVTQRNPTKDITIQAIGTEWANNAAMNAQLSVAKAALAKEHDRYIKMPAKEQLLSDMIEQVSVLKTTYEYLSSKYYDLVIQEQSTLPNGLIASYGHPPRKASFPIIPEMLAIIGAISLICGVAVARMAEKLDTRLRDPQTAEAITGIPILSAIPAISSKSIIHGKRPLIGNLAEDDHAFLESYRILRNNVGFASPDQELFIVGVTSPGRGEGKSTTTVNLAISLAMDGKRVLVIDGDLRRPSIHTALDLPREVGLTNVVAGRKTLEEAVLPTAFENVFALTSGPLPPNPTEFLNSVQSRKTFEKATELYDFVLVDCPPCAGLSDVQVIATIVQGMIVVISMDLSRKPQLESTVDTLERAGTRLLGTVLNRMVFRLGYGYYSYYYYYRYDEDDGKKGKRAKGKRKKTDQAAALSGPSDSGNSNKS